MKRKKVCKEFHDRSNSTTGLTTQIRLEKHVDSWENHNLIHISKNINVSYSHDFSTMFSITSGSEYLYFNFDLNTTEYIYDFSFPQRDIEDYSKFNIKFFFANNLESNLLSYSINR